MQLSLISPPTISNFHLFSAFLNEIATSFCILTLFPCLPLHWATQLTLTESASQPLCDALPLPPPPFLLSLLTVRESQPLRKGIFILIFKQKKILRKKNFVKKLFGKFLYLTLFLFACSFLLRGLDV